LDTGDELIWVIIYTGNVIMKLLYSYLKQTKCLFSRTENRKVKQILSGGWHQWDGGKHKERCRRVNMVEYSVLMYENGKMRPVDTTPGMGERGIKENDGGGEFNHDIL
jgi:hypothetical protein